MTEREKLIKELQEIKEDGMFYTSTLADFIIKDRLRVVEPLVKSLKNLVYVVDSAEQFQRKECEIKLEEALADAKKILEAYNDKAQRP